MERPSHGAGCRPGWARSVPRLLLPLLPLLTPSLTAQAGGVEVFAAEPLFAGGTRVSLSHIYETKGSLYRGSNEIPDALNREQDEQRLVLGIDRGVSTNFSVSALVPFVALDFDSDMGAADSAGLGDVALIGKYRFHREDWKQGTFNVALVGGLETPTGRTSEKDGGATLPPGLQPGKGSWNPFLSVSSNLSAGRYRLDGSAFYKLNTEGKQEYEDGDFFALALDGKYRFLHEQYPGPTAGVKLGLQYRHEGRDEQNGTSVVNSGSDELRVRTGLSWHPAPNIDFSFTVEIPVYRDFNGEQLAVDYRTFLALGLRF